MRKRIAAFILAGILFISPMMADGMAAQAAQLDNSAGSGQEEDTSRLRGAVTNNIGRQNVSRKKGDLYTEKNFTIHMQRLR